MDYRVFLGFGSLKPPYAWIWEPLDSRHSMYAVWYSISKQIIARASVSILILYNIPVGRADLPNLDVEYQIRRTGMMLTVIVSMVKARYVLS